MEKIMFGFSGGKDSTTCLLWAWGEFKKIKTGTFLYGQKHKLGIERIKNNLQGQHAI